MYAVKGSWVGQTFALARGNESEGKKSRVRRSKEERKAMAESFIKKYQKSNNGIFPSLNLTHKEVGGSFYTVREMVREIIQENRVLGPAKLSPEEQSANQFLEQDPLGSIATEPQTPLLLNSNETHSISNHHQGTGVELVLGCDEHDTGPDQQMFDNRQVVNGSQVDVKNKRSDEPTYIELQLSEPLETEKHLEEELAESKAKITPRVADEEQVLVSNGHYCAGPEHQMLDNGQIINGSQVDVRNKNSNELTCTEYHVSEPSEEERNVEEEFAASKAQVNPITEDVIVETFPLRTVTKTTDSLGVRLEVKDLSNPLEEKVEDKAVKNLSGPLFERSSGLVEKEVLENLADPSLESSNHSNPKEGIRHDAQGVKDLAAKVSCNDVGTPKNLEKSLEIDGAKAVNAPNTCTKVLNGTYTPETIVNETKADVQRGGNSQKGSNPTLDRIDLESLEGATKTSAKPESNPVLAIIQAFVAAFVKFWSD